jgi:hypothetical protein
MRNRASERRIEPARAVVGRRAGLVCLSVLALLAAPPASRADSCPNAAFRTGPSANLPDCRAYELVTGYKNVSQAQGLGAPTVLPDGSLLDLGGNAATQVVEPGSIGADDSFRISRGSSRWASVDITPPEVRSTPQVQNDPGQDNQGGAALGGVSADLSTFLWNVSGIDPAAITNGDPGDQNNGAQDVYSANAAGDQLTFVSDGVGGRTQSVPAVSLGSSADGSHALFETTDYTLAAPANQQTQGFALYERFAGQTRLVNVNTDGSLTDPCGAVLGNSGIISGTFFPAGQYTLTPQNFYSAKTSTLSQLQGAVSADGSDVFFTSPDPNSGINSPLSFGITAGCAPPQVYVRQSGQTTVNVSAPEPGVTDPTGTQPAEFIAASKDGSKVFFASAQRLTSDDTDAHLDLYERDLSTGTLTRISGGPNHVDDHLFGVMGVSQDGSKVYFVTQHPILPGQSATSQFYLYLWDGNNGRYTFITGLNDNQWENNLGARTTGTEVTPDGSHLLFASSSQLTGYDNHGVQELYRFSAADSSLVCLSCDPTGAPPSGPAELSPVTVILPSPLSMSDDGEQVFFTSPDQLVSADRSTHRQVYEWEADGAGSCHSDSENGGCLYLVSSGQSTTDDFLLGATPGGGDVFFETHDALVPQDGDDLRDVYDVRVGGGFPVPAPPAPCVGVADCRGAPPSNAAAPVAASISFSGPGSLSTTSPAPTTKVRVSKKTISGSTVTFSVKAPAKGTLTVSGAGLETVMFGISRTGSYQIRVRLSLKAAKLLKRKRSYKTTARIIFEPAGGSSSTASVPLTFNAKRSKTGS